MSLFEKIIFSFKEDCPFWRLDRPMLNIFTSHKQVLENTQNCASLTAPSGMHMALTVPWGLLSASWRNPTSVFLNTSLMSTIWKMGLKKRVTKIFYKQVFKESRAVNIYKVHSYRVIVMGWALWLVLMYSH